MEGQENERDYRVKDEAGRVGVAAHGSNRRFCGVYSGFFFFVNSVSNTERFQNEIPAHIYI